LQRKKKKKKPVFISLATILLELPVAVIQRADLSGLQPSRYAVEVESMLKEVSSVSVVGSGGTYVANTPSDGTLFGCRGALVGLAFDACFIID
jgi:hypothetical protein